MLSSSSDTLRLWRRLVEGLAGGKCVGDDRYVHRSAVPSSLEDTLDALALLAGCERDDFDVVRVSKSTARVSLLRYPGFFTEGFPTLTASWRVDLESGAVDRRSYRIDANPPVLHRKEQMLADDDPRRDAFAALTADAESKGLFEDTAIIGHRDQWDEELRARGVAVLGHKLVPRGDDAPVLRHRTAMARRALSTPMQALWRHGYLTAPHSVLDYGCGRGDDLAALRAIGLDASGWDPHFAPDGVRAESDVVNLGFVLNVIEDQRERADALRGAYGYARKVLSVSALIGGRTAFERYRLFRDGVLTSRGTFQKYFTHAELGGYITEVLGREPVSVGPGLYFVFRSDADEQDFLERRQRSVSVTPPSPPTRDPATVERATTKPEKRPTATTERRPKPARAPAVDELTTAPYEALWSACISLGRMPREADFDGAAEVLSAVGSPTRALKKLLARHGEAALDTARTRRKGDLLVFFALNLFERRRSSEAMSERVRADVREFWSTLPRAQEEARAMLFSLRETSLIAADCAKAAAEGVGYLIAGDSLQLDARLVNALSPALRTFLGCAGKLLGEAQDADMVKIHIGSGKATLLRYDDYEGAAIPLLIERVKVDLRRQQVDVFQYGDEFPPQPLYLKSRYMHPSLEGYEEQRVFDEAVRALPAWSDEGFGPPLEAIGAELERIEAPEGLVLTTMPSRLRSR